MGKLSSKNTTRPRAFIYQDQEGNEHYYPEAIVAFLFLILCGALVGFLIAIVMGAI